MCDEWVMSYVNMGGMSYLSMTGLGESLGRRQAYLGLGSSYCEMYEYLFQNFNIFLRQNQGTRRGGTLLDMIFISMPLYK